MKSYIKHRTFPVWFCCFTLLFSQNDPLRVDKSRGEWTLMVIPDTQGYSEPWPEEGYERWELTRTFEWILEVADALNIKVVQSVGDMVELHRTREWEGIKKDYYLLLDNGIPAIPAAGNHEWEGDEDFTNMNRYFPVSDFEQFPWWGGSYPEGKIQNSYQLFTIGNEDYLFITMQFQAGSQEVGATDAVDWVVGIMEDHPDKKIIFTSHWHDDQHHIPRTVDVFDNIVMTLAGHNCAEEYYVAHGRTHMFVQDYQCEGFSKGEEGLMQVRYYTFKPMEDKVEWYTYSAVANDGAGAFWTKTEFSQGSFDLVQEDPTLPTVYTLTLGDAAGGTITTGQDTTLQFEEGAEVILTAVPDEGYEFTGWGGDLSGAENPKTVTITADMNVTASFSEVVSVRRQHL